MRSGPGLGLSDVPGDVSITRSYGWSSRGGFAGPLAGGQLKVMPFTHRVAFVLSGGASLGATQSGMLQALYERGIRPDLLVGTSAGAINAAFIASRPQTPA